MAPGLPNARKIELYRAALGAWKPADGEAARSKVRQALALCLSIEAWAPFELSKTKETALAVLGRNEALCREAMGLWPELPNPYRTLAYTYYRAGRHAEALPLYREALARPDPPADTRLLLARCLEVLGRLEEALLEHEAVLVASGGKPEGFYALADALRILEGLDRPKEMIRLCLLFRDRGGDLGVEALQLRWFQAQRLLGFERLLARDWKGAIAAYGEAAAALAAWPALARLDSGGRGGVAEMLRLARDLESLGAARPVQTFRILALTIPQVEARLTDLRGKPAVYKLPALDPKTLPWRRKAEAYLALCVEAWSGGKLALAVDELDLDGALTGFQLNWMGNDPASGKEMHVADLASIRPSILPLLHETRNGYDAYIVYYNGNEGAGAGLHGRVYQLPGPGGGKSPVRRGHLDIPLNFLAQYDGPAILVHEFFHIVEGLAGLKPEHGYLPERRGGFPEWKGEGEFDYYRWHFANNLAAQGWEEASLVRRWPSP